MRAGIVTAMRLPRTEYRYIRKSGVCDATQPGWWHRDERVIYVRHRRRGWRQGGRCDPRCALATLIYRIPTGMREPRGPRAPSPARYWKVNVLTIGGMTSRNEKRLVLTFFSRGGEKRKWDGYRKEVVG